MFSPLIIDKFVEEGINTDILYDYGFFTPFFAFSFGIAKKHVSLWFQFPKITYCFTLTLNKEESDRIIDDVTIFPRRFK